MEAHTAFIRSSHPDVAQFASAEIVPSDRTLLVAWTARVGKPMYCDGREGPVPLNASKLEEATVVQDAIERVMVNDHPGILRLWSPRHQQPMYGARLPTIILNWYEGPILWTVQSSFLNAAEVLQVAESIGPTSVPGPA